MTGPPTPRRVLIANRGEIAVRVARTCAALGVQTVGVGSVDDRGTDHLRHVDVAVDLDAAGPSAYLDIDALLGVARDIGCDAVHPGYGFLSESTEFARRAREADLVFIGPGTDVLAVFGDKVSARRAAVAADVPVPRASGVVTAAEAVEFGRTLGQGVPLMVKAVAGGGGRGIRPVTSADDLAAAVATCASEALSAFGDDRVFVEELVPDARHIEVQVVGDTHGNVVALGERDCSLQRSRQKVVEFAPAPFLPDELRSRLHDAALRVASVAGLDSVGTVEFLVAGERLVFLETNPRLQVEHTVTEEVTGIDLVATQILLASGASLSEVGITGPPTIRGRAVQLRLNAERLADGLVTATTGTIGDADLPRGLGVRVESHARPGYRPSPRFDSLLAKIVVRTDGGHEDLLARARVALRETRITGSSTNLGLLQLIVDDVAGHPATTRTLDRVLADLTGFPEPRGLAAAAAAPEPSRAVADASADDPDVVSAPMSGVVVGIQVAPGDVVGAGTPLLLLESMKLEHVVVADHGGTVEEVLVPLGTIVDERSPLVRLRADVDGAGGPASAADTPDLDAVRDELVSIRRLREHGTDAARAESVARHHALGHRTARENVADLVEKSDFREIGTLAVSRQEHRRTGEWLREHTTGDGVVVGIARVNEQPGGAGGECAVLAYDYSVFAGTQGERGRQKTSRVLDVAVRARMPLVLFAEGGGGRPGDDITDVPLLGRGLFQQFAALRGRIPTVGIAAGRCFAGNAALLGMCDVTIATRDATVGMGGPALIEAAGLGRVAADDVGPARLIWERGAVDVLVQDEAAAVATARDVVGFFQGARSSWDEGDRRSLRHAVPQNRLRAYDVRTVVGGIADTGSTLELRDGFGRSLYTGLARLEGRPVAIVANDPAVGGGAIDSDAADKLTWFLEFVQRHGLPTVSVCDTPGFLVGPDSERRGAVRRMSAIFQAGAALTVPTAVVVTRKCYGLGAMAMAGPGREGTAGVYAWPTAEVGTMGIEGAVRLAYRRELEEAQAPQRQALFERLVADYYRAGSADAVASRFHVDEVVDPADTRDWLRLSLFGRT